MKRFRAQTASTSSIGQPTLKRSPRHDGESKSLEVSTPLKISVKDLKKSIETFSNEINDRLKVISPELLSNRKICKISHHALLQIKDVINDIVNPTNDSHKNEEERRLSDSSNHILENDNLIDIVPLLPNQSNKNEKNGGYSKLASLLTELSYIFKNLKSRSDKTVIDTSDWNRLKDIATELLKFLPPLPPPKPAERLSQSTSPLVSPKSLTDLFKLQFSNRPSLEYDESMVSLINGVIGVANHYLRQFIRGKNYSSAQKLKSGMQTLLEYLKKDPNIPLSPELSKRITEHNIFYGKVTSVTFKMEMLNQLYSFVEHIKNNNGTSASLISTVLDKFTERDEFFTLRGKNGKNPANVENLLKTIESLRKEERQTQYQRNRASTCSISTI